MWSSVSLACSRNVGLTFHACQLFSPNLLLLLHFMMRWKLMIIVGSNCPCLLLGQNLDTLFIYLFLVNFSLKSDDSRARLIRLYGPSCNPSTVKSQGWSLLCEASLHCQDTLFLLVKKLFVTLSRDNPILTLQDYYKNKIFFLSI